MNRYGIFLLLAVGLVASAQTSNVSYIEPTPWGVVVTAYTTSYNWEGQGKMPIAGALVFRNGNTYPEDCSYSIEVEGCQHIGGWDENPLSPTATAQIPYPLIGGQPAPSGTYTGQGVHTEFYCYCGFAFCEPSYYGQYTDAIGGPIQIGGQPTISSIDPPQWMAGTQYLQVTVQGENFGEQSAQSGIYFTGMGLEGTGVQIQYWSSNLIQFLIDVPVTAQGAGYLIAQVAAGQQGQGQMSVQGQEQLPEITAVNPRGNGWIEVYGNNFAGPNTTITVNGVVASPGYTGAHQVNALVANITGPGQYQVVAGTPAGPSQAFPFTVNPDPKPIITSVTAGQWVIGQQTVTIQGAGFGFWPTVIISGTGVSASVTSSADWGPTAGSTVIATVTVAPGTASQIVEVQVESHGYWGGGFQGGEGQSRSDPQSKVVAGTGCRVPVNFREDFGRDFGGGVLEFHYMWDASAGGAMWNLVGCQIGEAVTYPSNAFPLPFPAIPATGTVYITKAQGNSANFLYDYHWPALNPAPPPTGVGLPAAMSQFRPPYNEASFQASQQYYYQCSCLGNGATVLFPEVHTITRSVTSSGNGWQYTIQKDGRFASYAPLQ